MQHGLAIQNKTNNTARRGARMAALAVAMAAAALAAGCGGSDDEGGKPMELTILHIGDHHSTLDARARDLKLKNAAGERVTVKANAAGFARVKTAFDELGASAPNVLKLHTGDALTGTLYFNRAGANGEADAALMNTVCFDAFTLGNHEFDKGDSELRNFIGQQLWKGACKTPVISANVNFGASSALHASRAPGMVQPYTIIERGGQKIGIVGLTVALKTKESSSPDAGTTFTEEAAAAQAAIDRLKSQGIDKIVVASHIGYGLDRQIIPRLSGVDVVVGGDSHSLLGPETMAAYGVGTPAGRYAETLKNKDGDNVCLAHAWEYAQAVGELKVGFDAHGRVTACGGTPHVLIGGDFTVGGQAPSPADLKAFGDDARASGFLRVTAENAAAAATLKPFADKVAVFKAAVVATAPEELCSRRVPGGVGTADYSRSSAECNALGQVSARGGDIQQLVAQAYLEVANASYGGADISLQSGGGVRVPLKGTVTAANVIEVLPFGNLLWRLQLTGAEVRSMVEDGLDATFKSGGSTGPYPYTGGLRFDVDSKAAKGARASNLEVRNAATGQWQPLDAARTYRLFVLSFNATGGDGYETLKNVPVSRRQDIGVLDADVFQSYIDRLPRDTATGLPVLRRPGAELYSTKSFR